MAGKNEELNVISHLLEVEKEASYLVDDALKESEKRLSEARSQLSSKYKKEYESLVKTMDGDFQSKKNDLQKKHDDALAEYKSSVENRNQNTKAFNQLVHKLLFNA